MARRRKPKGRLEVDVLQDVLLALGSRPDVRLWRNNRGMAMNPNGRAVVFGTPGQADLSGILRLPCGVGVRLEVETKRERGGRQSDEQRAFQAMIERFGGCYVLAPSVAEAVAGVEAFLAAHRLTVHGDCP